MIFLIPLLLTVQNCMTPALSNSSDIVSTLLGIQQSPCLGNQYGFGLDFVIFIIATFVLSYYLRPEQAAAVGSFISMVGAVIFFVPVTLMTANQMFLFLGMMLFFMFISLINHIFHPFD